MKIENQDIPVIGKFTNLKNANRIYHNPAIYFKSILDKNNGLVQMQLPMGLVYMTDRAEIIKYVLQQNHKNYIKTEVVRTILREQAGNGLLTSDGDYWLQQRRAIQPGFHRKRLEGISKLMIEEIEHYMDDVFDKYAASGEEFDMSKAMMQLAFKIVSKSLFGEAVDDEKLVAIDEIVTKSQQFIINQVRRPFLKPWFWLSGAYIRNRSVKKRGDELIMEIIKERQKSGRKQDDLLDMLLETRYEDGTGMTDQQLLDEALILYVAGHETSANAMAWAWYLLAMHPDIEAKLLESVNETLGNNNPSFEQLRNLGYSLQVIEETMRLYPPAWLTDREALADDEFENIKIKEGNNIACLIYGVHHSKRYWENPEKFDPERFNAENKSKQIPFSYIPFGGGPRLCIGNNFALMEMQFVLSMMIKRYQFELIPNQQIDIHPLITLRPRYGIKMLVKKRK
jgi:cytochrome P450